jgi:UDP-glucose 4-epimerase
MGVLITGGMGYIGSRVAAKLPGSYIIDHKAGNDINFYTLDEYLPNCDTVIHLAGTHSFSAEDCYSDLSTFILLMKGMKYYNVKRLIMASSAAVYGMANAVIDEKWPTKPSTPYGRHKLMCEQIAQDFGIETVILRPFNVSGGLAKFIPNVKSGKVTIFGDGSAVRDFVHVEDLADAFVKAMEVKPGVFNIGSGLGHSLNQIIALRGNVEVDYQPARENDTHYLIADITKARTVLGWEPKHSIEDIVCGD